MLNIDWLSLMQIISIDIVLSADNALIIAMATKKLSKVDQNKAILIGVLGAIILRIIFATGVVYLLHFPLIYMVGGLLLIWIGYKLLLKDEETQAITSHVSLRKVVMTIISADLIMSLDNVVALVGASEGNLALLTFGVVISIPLILFGAKFIAMLIAKYPILLYLGCGVLVYTGVKMIVHEPFVFQFFRLNEGFITIILSVITTIGVIVSGYMTNKQHHA
ncbi:TerC family protein [Gracilibacillus sp. S3-1-1]|uniref:TerC family protein n=1 Tax=Gracilibacillus pellucidus TaxID=3095368 RepID=A0ACC6M581_9BACI|nr:TerC family protein [Gracilibacillus sp. S3-1-1]MDX8046051.1 TerC family protein [Gracilibacillus sp. S3-1-1]